MFFNETSRSVPHHRTDAHDRRSGQTDVFVTPLDGV